ncbi:hypothetical protein [Hahella ganghwensis]|uniref:hypothetical protein n=1 Tax=Hahella ganghwensis TaxID=286420 RepID=UPI00037F700D|nr:hypothetical protein [Hahella ganghwensis]
MAEAMKLDPLPYDKAFQLIEHVLYKGEYSDLSGKEGWRCFEGGLVTEREMRNLLMAHSATKIAEFNGKDEPNSLAYSSKELCHLFEMTLFGKIVGPRSSDVIDPWEGQRAEQGQAIDGPPGHSN